MRVRGYQSHTTGSTRVPSERFVRDRARAQSEFLYNRCLLHSVLVEILLPVSSRHNGTPPLLIRSARENWSSTVRVVGWRVRNSTLDEIAWPAMPRLFFASTQSATPETKPTRAVGATTNPQVQTTFAASGSLGGAAPSKTVRWLTLSLIHI